MILFGLVQEQTNADRDEVDWRPFVYGCVIGAVPWIAITAQLIVSATDGNGVPGFVVAIFITLFLLFNTFAVNMWLQYRGRGRWADPAFAERVYLILSLVAKSALAWQVLRRRARRRIGEDRSCSSERQPAHRRRRDGRRSPFRSSETPTTRHPSSAAPTLATT